MADTSIDAPSLTRRDKAQIAACSLGIGLLMSGALLLLAWVSLQ